MINKKKLKILMITPYYPPHVGGMEYYVYYLSQQLKKNLAVDIAVITSGDNKRKISITNENGIRIYRLPYIFKISNTPINPLWYFQIKNIIKKENPDIVNAHSPVPFISDVSAYSSGKIPFIITYHSGSMKKYILPIDIIIWIYEHIFLQITLKKATKIICSSDFVRKTIMKRYKNKVITITPAVDIKKYHPTKLNRKLSVLFVAGLNAFEKYKGLTILLDALKQIKKNIPDTQLVIVGDGNYRQYYENLACELDLERNVVFKGRLYGKKLVEEYQKTTVCVLPTSNDNFPTVLIEAMACSTPVIGTSVGSIPDIINHLDNGLLIPPQDSKALADALLTLLNNKSLSEKMGRNGYTKIKENLTWEHQSKKTYTFFQNIKRNYTK